MLWIRSEKTLWKASFRRREITDVIPLLFFLQRGAILLSGNAPIIKITLWGLSTPKNAPFLGAIYPQKRCTFANCRGFICNNCPTYLSPKSSHTSRQIGILHYSIKVFVGYWDMLLYYPSHRRRKAGCRKTSGFYIQKDRENLFSNGPSVFRSIP